MIKHKYADDVPVHLKMGPGGTDDQRLLVAVMRRTGPSEGMAIFDHKASRARAALTGHTQKPCMRLKPPLGRAA